MERVEKLATEVGGLRGEAAQLHAALDRHTSTMRRNLRLVVLLLVALTAAGALVAWQLHAQVETARRTAQDQRRLCPLVSLLIPQPGEVGPSTPRGVQMTKAARDYAAAIHC